MEDRRHGDGPRGKDLCSDIGDFRWRELPKMKVREESILKSGAAYPSQAVTRFWEDPKPNDDYCSNILPGRGQALVSS